jgi:hypothetical protein
MSRVEKVLFAWLVAMLVGVTATAGYVVVERTTRCARFDFDATAWHAHHGRDEAAQRLVECHRLEGLRADELRARLGKPSRRRDRHAGVALIYDAGTRAGFMFPSAETLEVELSDKHVVRRVYLVTADD